jgi:hypothetical protein
MGGVVDAAHHTGLAQPIVVGDEAQVDHQPNDFTGGTVPRRSKELRCVTRR